MATSSPPRVLLAGATGFVGRHAFVALRAAGYEVACASRHPDSARERYPNRHWVHMDMEDRSSLVPAMEGCDALLYLVHQMEREGYEEREAQAAEWVRQAAAEAGVKRIIYLGGVAPGPDGPCSPHLHSRLHVGEILREGPVTTIELRAAMIIGDGSASWQIVRDLAHRLPAMVLPKWLRKHSSPVAIDDIVAGLLWALDGAPDESAWYDLPGPEVISHRDLLARVARVVNGREPVMVQAPLVTPELSSYWIALVTRTDLHLARELVRGLQAELIPRGPSVWEHCNRRSPLSLDNAIRNALSDESVGAQEIEGRLVELGQHFVLGELA